MADRFVFGPAMGQDVVTDFADDSDLIVLRAIAGVQTIAQALSHATQSGADVVFDFGADGGFTVTNIQLAALSDDLLIA